MRLVTSWLRGAAELSLRREIHLFQMTMYLERAALQLWTRLEVERSAGMPFEDEVELLARSFLGLDQLLR